MENGAERLRFFSMPYKDPEKKRAYRAAYRAANLEKARARNAAWRAANPEKARAFRAVYRAANLEKERAQNVAWRAANPEKERARKAAYDLARALGVPKSDVPQDMLDVKLAIIKIQREVKRHENA
jgi:hypothetical protein